VGPQGDAEGRQGAAASVPAPGQVEVPSAVALAGELDPVLIDQDLEIAHLHRTADGPFVAAHGFRATQDKDVALRAAGREHLILDVGEIETDLDRLAPRCWQDLIDVIDVAIDHHRLTAHREAGGRSDLGGRRPRRSAPLVIGIPVELRRRAGRQRAAQGSQQALARRPTASHMHGVSRRDLHARPPVRRPWRQLEVRLRGRRR